ncbi:hypothetical protein FACS1894172_01360 [Spirochaetia bacterium]|nr:hypothetical protein FACS1894172_01360 [Spirochaetia bacterium]
MKKILIFLLISSGVVWGQEARKISADEAVQLAIRNNLSLTSTRIDTGIKQRKQQFAWNSFIPTVQANGTLSRPNEATAFMPGVDPGSPQWTLSGSLQFTLNLNVALFEAMKTLRLDYQGGVISYEKAKAQLERDIRKAYYNMILLQENIKLLKENQAAANSRVQTAQANYRAGTAPQLNYLQAQVAAENLRPTIAQSENGLKLSMAQFAMYLGLPFDTQFELTPISGSLNFIPLDLHDLIRQSTGKKPEILELRNSILLMQSTRKRTALQMYTPTLSLGWGLSPSFGGLWGESLFNGDMWSEGGRFTLTLSFGLNSLFPFGSEKQGLNDLDDNLRTLTLGLSQMVNGVEIEIYNTVLSLEHIRESAEAQARTVSLAQQSYSLTNQAYRSGFSDLMEVQNAELELRKAQVGMIEQQYNYLNGLIDLEYSIGVPFGTLSKQVLEGEVQ